MLTKEEQFHYKLLGIDPSNLFFLYNNETQLALHYITKFEESTPLRWNRKYFTGYCLFALLSSRYNHLLIIKSKQNQQTKSIVVDDRIQYQQEIDKIIRDTNYLQHVLSFESTIYYYDKESENIQNVLNNNKLDNYLKKMHVPGLIKHDPI